MQKGKFVISLDLEMMWGMLYKAWNHDAKDRVKNVWSVVPSMLALFQQYGIHATWAVVGLILFHDVHELEAFFVKNGLDNPDPKSPIHDQILSLKADEPEKDLFFCPSLVERISRTEHQEIASHSFSHYCAQEVGQAFQSLEEDISVFNKVLMHKLDIQATTYVPPRFQHDGVHDRVLASHSYNAHRGIKPENLESKRLPGFAKRSIRFFDRYLNLLGHRTFQVEETNHSKILNIKESYYFRPYNAKMKYLERMKVRRIMKDMTHAAQKGEIFHLWWHPHDFGNHMEKNLQQLEIILQHFSSLQKRHGYQSRNMREIAENSMPDGTS